MNGTSPGVRIILNHVHKRFDRDIVALSDIDLEVNAGDFVALLGPSGCGKSTLLKIIADLDRPSSGKAQVLSDGDRRAQVAYVFQDAHLLPWRTVLDNVALPLELMGEARQTRASKALEALDLVGLREFTEAYPEQLSGGMKMRASIARALVTRPKLLLMDEPFAALDEITRLHLDEQLRALWLKERLTILFVTHSISEATLLSDRTLVFSRRPGRIVLDTKVPLGPERSGPVRASPEFIRHVQSVHEALARAEAAS